MRDDDHRHPLGGELAHHGEDLTDELGVQGRRRLVEEHELGVHRQGPRDGDPLLLASGQLCGVGRRLVLEPHPLEQGDGPLARGGLLLTPDLDRRLHDVLERRLVREEVEALEDHADLASLGGDALVGQPVQHAAAVVIADEVAVDPDPAAVDRLELVDAAQEGGLPRPGRAEEADDLAGVHVQVDALEDLVAVEGLHHVDGVHQRRVRMPWCCPAVARLRRHHAPPMPAGRANRLFFGLGCPKPRPKYRSR